MKSSSLIKSYSFELEKFLDNTDSIIVILLDSNFIIKEYSKSFIKLLENYETYKKVKDEDIKEKSILNFLMSESHSLFKLNDNKQSDFIKAKLNFYITGNPYITISCYIFNREKFYLIIGEQIILNNSHFMDKMTILNNEMANMVREIHQKNREIEKQKYEIEKKNHELENKNRDLQNKNRELEQAHSKIKILSGIIPICMHCKQIRDDQGYWNRVEEYITEHSNAQFSHSICPKCMEQYYSEYIIE